MKTNAETRAGMSIVELVALIRRRSDRPVIGCTDEAIAGICAIAPGPLPSDYLEWLRLAGQSPGDFMLGTDLAAPLIPRMQEGMRATSRQFGGPLPDVNYFSPSTTIRPPHWVDCCRRSGWWSRSRSPW